MQIVNQEIEAYLKRIAGLSPAPGPEMESYAAEKDFPIVGPLVGQLLRLLAGLAGARRVLEMGSGFGYSALWFAQAMDSQGEIILTEGSTANLTRARDYLSRIEDGPRFDYRHGDAIEWAEKLEGPFDIVFIDVDKHQYPQAFQRALPQLAPGGLIITDNTLWSGKVTSAAEDSDRDTQGVQEYNRLVFGDSRLHSTIIPIRDGVAVSRWAAQVQ